jgi:molybdopterin converting factor subunit 1
MKIKVRFFAAYREIAGTNQVELQFQEGAAVTDLLKRLKRDFAGLPGKGFRVAINAEFVEASQIMQPGDEVALIPPVSGG